MVHAHHKQQHYHQDHDEIRVVNHVRHGKDDRRFSNEVCCPTKQSVRHVAAIQLTDRHHVKPGDQQSNPAGNKQRVQLT